MAQVFQFSFSHLLFAFLTYLEDNLHQMIFTILKDSVKYILPGKTSTLSVDIIRLRFFPRLNSQAEKHLVTSQE